MSVMDDHSLHLQQQRRRRDESDYRWVFWFAYPFFLAAAIAARLMPGRERAGETGRPRPTVFKAAWIAANSAIPFVFMN